MWRRNGKLPLILLQKIKRARRAPCPCSFLNGFIERQPLLPLKSNQSPCEVAINRSIGSDSHAFVRDAMKACRARTGAASGGTGGPPLIALSVRLLLGQMIPQTFSSITKPYAPPMPIE